MTDVDRYITDAVLEAVGQRRIAEHALRAALPDILAQHRADVLREVAIGTATYCSRQVLCLAAALGDEAVAE